MQPGSRSVRPSICGEGSEDKANGPQDPASCSSPGVTVEPPRGVARDGEHKGCAGNISGWDSSPFASARCWVLS